MQKNGFTLAELLVALGILGVIAVFTIPKVLTSNTGSRYNANAREMISAVSGAYESYQKEHTATGATTADDLVAYLNYVAIDSGSTGYDGWNSGTGTCDDGVSKCLVMHNGGLLVYDTGCSFGGTGANNAIYFRYDHDRKISGEISLGIVLYYNGRVSTRSGLTPGTSACSIAFSPNPDPSWFSW